MASLDRGSNPRISTNLIAENLFLAPEASEHRDSGDELVSTEMWQTESDDPSYHTLVNQDGNLINANAFAMAAAA